MKINTEFILPHFFLLFRQRVPVERPPGGASRDPGFYLSLVTRVRGHTPNLPGFCFTDASSSSMGLEVNLVHIHNVDNSSNSCYY